MVDYSHFSPSLQIALKRLEDIWGGELPAINSGYRDPVTNAKAGGAKGSQHLHGNAIDWATAGMSQDERMRFLDATRKAGFQGFGGYSSGNIHTDVGPARYWGDDYSGKSAPQWLRDWYSGSPSGPRISAKDYNMAMNKQEEEQGFDVKGGLLSFADALNNLILPAARNQNTAGQLAEYQKQKEQVRSANKTAAYFESIGRSDLAQLVKDRAISGRDAFSTYTQEQAAARSLAAQQAAADLAYKRDLQMLGVRDQYAQKGEERALKNQLKIIGVNKEYDTEAARQALADSMVIEAYKVGIKPDQPLTELAKLQSDFNKGLIDKSMFETGVSAFANKNKMGVRVGKDGIIEFVQGSDLPKLTEAQSKDINWAYRMEGALKSFEPVSDTLVSLPNKVFGLDPTGLGRYLQSGDYQKAEVAGLEFLAPLLRKDTGAAVTPKEWDFYSKIYIPKIGDGPEALAAKREARARALDAIKRGIPQEYIQKSEAEKAGILQEGMDAGLIKDPYEDLLKKYGG